MNTDTLVAPLPIINETAAERAAVTAELVSLTSEQTMFSKAKAAVLARIEQIRVTDLSPLEQELQDLGAREKSLRSRLNWLAYQDLGPDDTRRAMAFETLQQVALTARDKARVSIGGTHLSRVIAQVWDKATTQWQASCIGGVFGSPAVSAAQRNADHVELFRDLAAELNRLAGLSLDEKVRMGARLEAER